MMDRPDIEYLCSHLADELAPTPKERRERMRFEASAIIMGHLISGVLHAQSECKIVYDEFALSAVSAADALLAELDRTKGDSK